MSQTDDIIKSPEQLAQFSMDLTDHEIGQIAKVLAKVQETYKDRFNTPENLDQLRDEVLTRLAEIGILATVDPTPCFHNEPPIVEILGKVPGHEIHNHGFDHEKKQWEVRKANELGEAYRGQKEKHNG